jgi:hypothetical protein
VPSAEYSGGMKASGKINSREWNFHHNFTSEMSKSLVFCETSSSTLVKKIVAQTLVNMAKSNFTEFKNLTFLIFFSSKSQDEKFSL